jgi:hypothetical protein
MSLYYFDLRDGSELVIDDDGTELRDMSAAQNEAARALSGLAWDAMRSGDGVKSQKLAISVRNAHGPVLDVKISFEVARATTDTARHVGSDSKENHRLLAAFARMTNEDMRATVLALAQRYASGSPEFLRAMQKVLEQLETRH